MSDHFETSPRQRFGRGSPLCAVATRTTAPTAQYAGPMNSGRASEDLGTYQGTGPTRRADRTRSVFARAAMTAPRIERQAAVVVSGQLVDRCSSDHRGHLAPMPPKGLGPARMPRGEAIGGHAGRLVGTELTDPPSQGCRSINAALSNGDDRRSTRRPHRGPWWRRTADTRRRGARTT